MKYKKLNKSLKLILTSLLSLSLTFQNTYFLFAEDNLDKTINLDNNKEIVDNLDENINKNSSNNEIDYENKSSQKINIDKENNKSNVNKTNKASNDSSTIIKSTINIEPYITMSLSTNNIDFGNVNFLDESLSQNIVATISSNGEYNILASGDDFENKVNTVPISNMSLSIDNNESKPLSSISTNFSENNPPGVNIEHNLNFKIKIPLEAKKGTYTGIINIIASPITEYIPELPDATDTTKSFQITYKTTTANESIELSLPQKGDSYSGYKDYEYKYNFEVDWGDDTTSQITSWDDIDKTHSYKEPGNYKVSINGIMEGWNTVHWNSDDNKSYLGSADNIISIDQWGETDLKYISFDSCENIVSSIPSPTKNSFKDIKSFNSLFYACSGLTGSIPEDLFINTSNVINFYYTFAWCDGLSGSIPENLFANSPNVTSFLGTFWDCSGLSGSIPEGLFSNNTVVTDFAETFDGCSGLTGAIPKNLFANNPEVLTFSCTFLGCSGLSGSIPEGLFDNNLKVTCFSSTFDSCSGLTGEIPQNLFANNTEVTDFSYVFLDCIKLTGLAPRLWETHTNVEDSDMCFNGCTNLSNYTEIPSGWK